MCSPWECVWMQFYPYPTQWILLLPTVLIKNTKHSSCYQNGCSSHAIVHKSQFTKASAGCDGSQSFPILNYIKRTRINHIEVISSVPYEKKQFSLTTQCIKQLPCLMTTSPAFNLLSNITSKHCSNCSSSSCLNKKFVEMVARIRCLTSGFFGIIVKSFLYLESGLLTSSLTENLLLGLKPKVKCYQYRKQVLRINSLCAVNWKVESHTENEETTQKHN